MDERQLADRVADLARQIEQDYRDRPPFLIGILKGSFIFLADLIRNLGIEYYVDFIAVTSYDADPHRPGNVKLLMDLSRNISGKHVLIVEDIIDSGGTLSYIYHNLRMRQPASLEIVALLKKSKPRSFDLPVKYVGFDIPDRFVVGYGLDEAEAYRGLPFIGCVEKESVA